MEKIPFEERLGHAPAAQRPDFGSIAPQALITGAQALVGGGRYTHWLASRIEEQLRTLYEGEDPPTLATVARDLYSLFEEEDLNDQQTEASAQLLFDLLMEPMLYVESTRRMRETMPETEAWAREAHEINQQLEKEGL